MSDFKRYLKIQDTPENINRPSAMEKNVAWSELTSLIRKNDEAAAVVYLSKLDFFPELSDDSLAKPLSPSCYILAAQRDMSGLFIALMEKEHSLIDPNERRKELARRGMLGIYDISDKSIYRNARLEEYRPKDNPVIACLSVDSPKCLCSVLEHPVFGAQLLNNEKKLREHNNNRVMEASIVFYAMIGRAGKCLSFLLSIPEIADDFIQDKIVPYNESSFVHEPSHFKSEEKIGYSFFFHLLDIERKIRDDLDTHTSHMLPAFRDAISLVASRSSEVMAPPQSGTGMRWIEGIVDRCHNFFRHDDLTEWYSDLILTPGMVCDDHTAALNVLTKLNQTHLRQSLESAVFSACAKKAPDNPRRRL